MSTSVFFWSSNSKKKLFWIYFWTKSARSAELFFGVCSFFLGFEPARSAGIIFWSFFLNKNRREAPIIIFWSVFRANNYFLNKNGAKRRIFFGVSNYFLGFFSARSAGIFFWSFFLNKKSMDFLEFFFGVELKTLKKTLLSTLCRLLVKTVDYCTQGNSKSDRVDKCCFSSRTAWRWENRAPNVWLKISRSGCLAS